jgi:TolC family type I secretion outer membrane protein
MKRNPALVIGLFAMLSLPAALAQAESLEEALVAAYTNNPTLLAQRAGLRAIDEGVSQALGAWRPTVTLAASLATRRSKTNVTNRTITSQPRTLSLSISQSLYRGGRTRAGVGRTEATVQAGRAQLRVVEQRVLLATVTAYLNVLRDQALVQLSQNNTAVLQRQLDATRDRFEVGELTRTDVGQGESRLSRAISDLVQAEGNLQSSRAAYETVVGNRPAGLERVPELAGLPLSLEDALATALERNPDLAVAANTAQASAFAVRAARGVLLPTVSLAGSLSRSDDATTRGSESTSSSLTASVSIPLYQSGSEYSDIRELGQTNNQRRIQVEESRRDVTEDVKQAWERLNTATARIHARVDEVAAAEVALDGVRQETEVGSRTTLDVLDAEQELLDARVSLVSAERDEYVAGFELRSAIGLLTAADIGLPVSVYDPGEYYSRVRNRLIGTAVGAQ